MEETWELVRIEGRMRTNKYREMLEENLLQGVGNLKLGQQLPLDYDRNLKHTTKMK